MSSISKYLPIIIPVGLSILILIGGLIYIRSQATQTLEKEVSKQVEDTLREVPRDLPTDLRIENLEDENKELKKELESLKTALNKSTPQTQGSVLTDSRLRILETSVAQIKGDIISLQSSDKTLSAKKNPVVYIPLGSGDGGGDVDWRSYDSYQATFDPANFPGYTNMQLEVLYKMEALGSTGYVRLFNNTDGTATSPEISTTSNNFAWYTSGTFTLPAGSKVYKLQLKSPTQTNVILQLARIKVNF